MDERDVMARAMEFLDRSRHSTAWPLPILDNERARVPQTPSSTFQDAEETVRAYLEEYSMIFSTDYVKIMASFLYRWRNGICLREFTWLPR